jgi:hypothetical protein
MRLRACRDVVPTRTPFPTILAAVVVLLGASLWVGHGEAGRGRWTPAKEWDRIAVHMALSPGDGNPYLAHVIWWDAEAPSGWFGRDMGWRASGDDTALVSYVDAKFDTLPFANPGMNLFCGGLTHLSDGRLLVVGGTEEGSEYGIKSARAYKGSAHRKARACAHGVRGQRRGARGRLRLGEALG